MTRWVSGLVGVLAVVVLAGGTYLGRVPLPAGLAGTVAVVGAFVAIVNGVFTDVMKSVVQDWRSAGKQQRAAIRAHTRDPLPGGRLPRLRGFDDPRSVDARGRRGMALVPYIPRDRDEAVRRAFDAGRHVLIEGPSASGKTRTAFETVRRLAHQRSWRLLVPSKPDSLARLVEAGVRLRGTVIWLDDLETYLAQGGLDRDTLAKLAPANASSRVRVVATIRSKALAPLEESPGSLPRPVRELLADFEVFRLKRELTASELGRAEEFRHDERIAAALDAGPTVRLAEYLAGGPAALERWNRGVDGGHPLGASVVSAAVYSRCAGHLAPFAEASLEKLHECFVDPEELLRPDSPTFAEALAWATSRIDDRVACLNPIDGGLFQPLDYLVDQMQGSPDTPPMNETAWKRLATVVTPADVFLFAASARRSGHEDVAAGALRSALEADPDDGDLRAALGTLLYEIGRFDDAEEHLRRATGQGVPQAANLLGVIVAEYGESDEAAGLFKAAIRNGASYARNNLALCLAADGQTDDAEKNLQAVTQDLPQAMNNLALLLADDDRLAEALGWCESATEAGVRPAASNLGVLQMESGRHDQAETTLAEAAADDPRAHNNLGVLFAYLGHLREAETHFRQAIDDGVAAAAANLARLLESVHAGDEAEHLRAIARKAGIAPADKADVVVMTEVAAYLGIDGQPRSVPLPHARAAHIRTPAQWPPWPRTGLRTDPWAGRRPGTYTNLVPARQAGSSAWSRFATERNRMFAQVFGDPSSDLRRFWVASRLAEGVSDDLTMRYDDETFSFLLLGSTGGGGAAQYAVVPGLLRVGATARFLIICGDVLSGSRDEEQAGPVFFRPYGGFQAPIFAVPGDHDWSDGLFTFMRIFCRSRVSRQELADASWGGRLARLLWRQSRPADEQTFAAARTLRSAPRQQGDQPGPYWAIDTPSLRIIGIDTGLIGVLDRDQAQWLRRVSAGPKAKVLVSHRSIRVSDVYHPLPIEGGDMVDEIVRQPEHNYVAAIGGDIHNYQHHLRKVGERTISYIVSGGGGAAIDPTHTIRKLSDEESFRCYPLRGDSLTLFSRARRPPWWWPWARTTITPDAASAYVADRLGIAPPWSIDRETRVNWQVRRRARPLFRRWRGMSTRERLAMETPPLFKSFLHVTVTAETLRIRCHAATGVLEHEIDPPLEDEVSIRLNSATPE